MDAYIHALLGGTLRVLIPGLVRLREHPGLQNRKRLVPTRAVSAFQLDVALI